MKKITCSKCHWFTYNPPQKKEDYSLCVNCGYPFDYSKDVTEDDMKSLPIDWSKHGKAVG